MKISFDLDDMLFVSPETFETEPPLKFPLNRLFPDRLRKGTADLMRELREEGFEVWIYTSSFRSETYIRRLFGHYGIRLDGVVNGTRHQKEVQKDHKGTLPSKLPGYYRISLHVDDEDFVEEMGKRYGFRTLKVREPDKDWTDRVLREARKIRRIEKAQSESS